MKKILTLILTLAITVASNAQITIVSGDLPSVGDTLRYSTANADVSSLIAISGANKTWDASFLVADFQDRASFKTPTSINFLYLTSFGGSTYGTESETQAINLAGYTATDGYDFFKSSTSLLTQDGRGFSFQGLPLSQTWKDTVFRLPLAFGNIDSCRFASNELNVGVATLKHVGKRVNTVDGWGSITTPYGTFDCIRIKSVLRTVDTIKTSLVPIPIGIPQQITEYRWYAKGKKLPVLTVSTNVSQQGNTTTIKYRDGVRPAAFLDEANFSLNKKTFTVGGGDTCVISDVSGHPANSRSWTITPATWTYTGGTNSGSEQAKILFTAAGTYTVKLRVVYNAGADDTTIVNCITVSGSAMAAGFKASSTTAALNGTVVKFTDTTSGSPNTWKWSFDPTSVTFVNSTSATSQNPEVKFTAEGFYTVTMDVSDGTNSQTVTKQNLILVMNTGLNEYTASAFKVYPNPVSDKISIIGEVSKVELYTLTGQMIKQSNVGTLAVEEIQSGIYLLKAVTKDGVDGWFRINIQH